MLGCRPRFGKDLDDRNDRHFTSFLLGSIRVWCPFVHLVVPPIILEKLPTRRESQPLLNAKQGLNFLMNGRGILDSLSRRPMRVIIGPYEDLQVSHRGSPGSTGSRASPSLEPHPAHEERRAEREAQIFSCGICLEIHKNNFLAYVIPCGHPYCRQCLKDYAVSKIEERCYPILCPGCLAGKDRSDHEPEELNDLAIQHLGLDEAQYRIFDEMQMAPFSTIIHCRKCLNTIFVDKEEYEEAKEITCPLPGCNNAWCKSCSETINIGRGPKHKCDGTSELNRLMRQRGWKHCPGCHTPAEKISGCNHMTCLSPGCNAHFCYICGELIARSVLRPKIRNAVSRHYDQCRLF